MKLVFVTGTLQSGGAERVLSILCTELLKYQYEITIICYYKTSVFYEIDKRIRIINSDDCVKSSNVIYKSLWFRSFVKEYKPHAVIAFMNPFYLFTLYSLININVPIIISDRNDPRNYSYIRKLLTVFVLKTPRKIVVQTQSIKNYYSEKIQKKISIIYNPIDTHIKIGEALAVEKEFTICAVGRLSKQKNYPLLISAFSKLCEKFPHYNLKIYGDGEQYVELKNLINSLNLNSRAFLMGRRKDIVDEIKSSRIFVMTSNYEGMSNALIEALCLGLPVVTTKVSGAIEIIRDGEDGILIDIGSEDQLVKGLEKLIIDNQYSEYLANNASSKSELFSVNRIVNQWHEIIKSVAIKA